MTFVERPSLTAIEQRRDNNYLVHVQLGAYCDDPLSPYLCPQPANGSTGYSQSV